jgi:hypothetical protein
MAKLDWNRELREARKRKHGAISVWSDPSALSMHDQRELEALLDLLAALVTEFRAMSRTQQDQRRSEFEFRLRRLRDQAVEGAAAIPNITARRAFEARSSLLIEGLSEGSQ